MATKAKAKTSGDNPAATAAMRAPWSPSFQVCELLDRLESFSTTGFVSKVFDQMMAMDELSGDSLLEYGLATPNLDEQIEIPAFSIVLALAYCVETLRAEARRDWDCAWDYVQNATYWSGFAAGTNISEKGVRAGVDVYVSLRAKNAAATKLLRDKDGKHSTMIDIRNEWTKRKNSGAKFTATAFAKEMANAHGGRVTVEHIKNRQTTWNKEYQPAS